MRGSLLTRHFAFVVITLVLAVAGTVLISTRLASNTLENETLKELRRERILFDGLLCDTLSESGIDSKAKLFGEETGIRYTVIFPDGRVIADSEKKPSTMENHADRPEIISAIQTGDGYSVRYSATLKEYMVYSAGRSLDDGGKLRYVIRTSKPIEALRSVNAVLARRSIFWGAVLLAISLVIAFISRGYITKSIERVSSKVRRIAQGDFSDRLSSGRYTEFEELEKSVNTLAGDLEKAFDKLERQRKNLLTILQSLGEGVIVLDDKGAILLMNDTAQSFTDLDYNDVRGKDILSTLMIPELREMVSDRDKTKAEYSSNKRRFKTRKTYVEQLDQIIISINDITESYNIQQTKADFVSNVSHELKTPLTLIKGFAETLEMEPFDDDVKGYIVTIMRHTDRMIALVQDLLTLSRIEQTERLETCDINLPILVEQVIFLFKTEAREKKIDLIFSSPEYCPSVRGDENLLEIALSNLIDNSIKYTPEGGEIRISIDEGEKDVVLSVVDTGIGIPEEDISRIFERFYTVDKSRSNSLYGTGLGLSIVKHIALLHSGEITAESEPGVGSLFRLKIPK